MPDLYKKPVKEGVDFFSFVRILLKRNKSCKIRSPHLWAVWESGAWLLSSSPKHLLAWSRHPGAPQTADSALQALSSLEERRASSSLSLPPCPAGAPLSGGLAVSTEECHSGLRPGLRQKPFWSQACFLRRTGPCPLSRCLLGVAAKFIPLN